MTLAARVVRKYKSAATIRSPETYKVRWRSRFPFDMENGKEVEWPDVRGYSRYVKEEDAHGAASELTYEFNGNPLFSVDFEANLFSNAPHKWEAMIGGSLKRGTWKTLKEVPKVLDKVKSEVAKADAQQKAKVEKTIEGMGGSKWNADYDVDMDEVVYSFTGMDEDSDAFLNVTFYDVSEVVDGGSGTYYIHGTAGADYQGHFGEKTQNGKWSSIQEISRILGAAEKLAPSLVG